METAPPIRIDFNVDDTLRSVRALLARLGDSWRTAEPVELDLTDCKYLGPSAVVVLAALARSRALHGATTRARLPVKPQLRAYCTYAGLEHAFGLGPEPGVQEPKSHTTPLAVFVKELPRQTLSRAQSLAEIWGEASEDAIEHLLQSLSEVAANVLDHARSPVGGLLSFKVFVEKRHDARFAIADLGHCFLGSLREAGHAAATDEAAVRAVMLEEVTSKSQSHNLGQGLKNLMGDVKATGGRFFVLSGNAAFEWNGQKRSVAACPERFPGTLVFASLPTKKGQQTNE